MHHFLQVAVLILLDNVPMYFILSIGLIELSPTEYSIDFETFSRLPLSYQVRLLLKKLTLYKNTLQFY